MLWGLWPPIKLPWPSSCRWRQRQSNVQVHIGHIHLLSLLLIASQALTHLFKSDHFENAALRVVMRGCLLSTEVFLQVAGRCFEGVLACLREVAIAIYGGSVHLRVVCRWQRRAAGWWLKLEARIGVRFLFRWLFWLCEYSLLNFRICIKSLFTDELILIANSLHIIWKLSHLLWPSRFAWKTCTK